MGNYHWLEGGSHHAADRTRRESCCHDCRLQQEEGNGGYGHQVCPTPEAVVRGRGKANGTVSTSDAGGSEECHYPRRSSGANWDDSVKCQLLLIAKCSRTEKYFFVKPRTSCTRTHLHVIKDVSEAPAMISHEKK